MINNTLMTIVLVLGAATLLVAESNPLPGSTVSAVYHEGVVSFRVDHPGVQSLRVQVFETATDTLLFDSGARRGDGIEWGVRGLTDTEWRFVVEAWNAHGELIVSQNAVSAGLDEITVIPFDTVPQGLLFKAASSPIVLEGDVEFGPVERLGRIADFSGFGGRLDMYDEQGFIHSYLSPDASGTGGRLAVTRNISSVGFVVDGNYNGTEKPKISMTGASSAVFDMSLNGGNNSVSLPIDAISSSEMFNEGGVANNWNQDTVSITSTMVTLTSRTIQAPSIGYVLAFAQADFSISHKTTINPGISDSISYAVSTSGTDTVVDDRYYFRISDDLPPARYYSTESSVQLFQVSAGSNTFYFNAKIFTLNNATGYCDRARLSLVFIPTAYGSVSFPSKMATGGEDLDQEVGEVGVSSMAAWEIDSEREESIAFNQARISRELAAMQDQLEALQQELDASERR